MLVGLEPGDVCEREVSSQLLDRHILWLLLTYDYEYTSTAGYLCQAGLPTIRNLLQYSKATITQHVWGVGPARINFVEARLHELGLSFPEQDLLPVAYEEEQ